jgi:hypothetical protein
MAEGHTSGLSPERGLEESHSESVPQEAVREELKRILASHEFRTSKRSQEFLCYVIDHTLNGNSDTLKERTIGIEVFGRTASYDPSDDATVRVKAGEVRRRLGLYYASQGGADPVRIELPAGTYVPEFHWTEAHVAANSPVQAPSHESNPASQVAAAQMPVLSGSVRRRWLLAAGCGLSFVMAAVGLWIKFHPSLTILDQFWAPVLQGSSPVSLCVAFVPVYAPNRDPDPKNPLKVEDFVYLPDHSVGGGDLIAVSRLSAMLTRMQRPYNVRLGNAVSFQDLRSAPAILVGYSYTQWREISSEMRFFIEVSRRFTGITDNGAPTKWSLPNLPPDRHTSEDYAIVSRVFHPDTHAMLMEVAGITQYGTDAAGDLVTQGDLLAEALRGAPAGWQQKNLQLILHVKVIAGTPTTPKVVAMHFW